MIAYLQGQIASVAENSLVVTTSGVGFLVGVPAPLAATCKPNDRIGLHTHLVVREDALSLYGFETQQERDTFLLLLGVSGIGPKIALAILSVLSLDAIRRAVLSEQPEVFSRVPGVGKRNAQKILIYLQGRIKGEGQEAQVLDDSDAPVLDALTSLGYSVVEAQAAVQSLPKDAPADVEERLRMALRYFSG